MIDKNGLKRLIVPLILEQLLAVSVGMVDTIMVSTVGEVAVSGVALVDNINRLVIHVLSAFAAGGVVISSQYYGSGNMAKTRKSCAQLEMLMFMFSILTAVLCVVFSRSILGAVFGSVEDDVNITVTTIIVAIMAGASELIGEREIIFPEITAIAVGIIISPKLPWRTSKLRILILIAICSVTGVMINLFLPFPEWVKMAASFVVSQVILILSGTSFVPLISATVLPVMLGTDTFIYPVSAILLTAITISAAAVMEKAGIKETCRCDHVYYGKKDIAAAAVLSVIVSAAVFAALKIDLPLCVAPPIIVAFSEFMRKNNKARQTPVKTVLLIFICACAGTVCRYVLSEKFGLQLAVSAAVSSVAMLSALHASKMYLPPAGALAILAMLIPAEDLIYYPAQVFLGVGVFMLVAILINGMCECYKTRHKEKV